MAPQPELPAEDAVFWTSYVKGMARACCALVVADLILDEWVRRAMPVAALAAPRPSVGSLAESLAAIHIRRGLLAVDRASVALEMPVCVRGVRSAGPMT